MTTGTSHVRHFGSVPRRTTRRGTDGLHDSPLEGTGFEPSVPLLRKGLSAVAERRCRTDKPSAGRLAVRDRGSRATAGCRLCRTATRRMRDVLYTPIVGEQTIDYRRRRCSGSGIFGKSAVVSGRWACALSTTGGGLLSIADAISMTGFSALGETGDGTNFCAAFNTSASCTYARA